MELTLTNNFYNCARTTLMCDYQNPGSVVDSASGLSTQTMPVLGPVTDITGANVSQIFKSGTGHSLFKFSHENTNSAGNTQFLFGTGTNIPSVTDINITGDLSSSLTVFISARRYYGETTSGITFTLAVTNTSASEVTISEIGMVKRNDQYSSTSSILYGRAVLDTPVTLAANDATTFTVSVSISNPTA